MERHKENPTTKQTKPNVSPQVSLIHHREGPDLWMHIQRPPTLLLRASRPPCRKLHVSGSPPILFPCCLALIRLLGQEEQRWPLPESTEMEETEFLTRQRETQWREETLIWRGRERMRQEQIVRGCQVSPSLERGNELFKSSGSQMVLLQNQVLHWTSSRDLKLFLCVGGAISK